MPWKQWAYLERVTSPDFQNYIQNQTVPQFTNVAQRDALWTPVPPPTGALCVTQDTQTLWQWTGSAWVAVSASRMYVAPISGGPFGTAEAVFSGGAFTVPSMLRPYTIALFAWWNAKGDTASDVFALRIRHTNVTGTVVGVVGVTFPAVNIQTSVSVQAAENNPAGSPVTYVVSGQRAAGTGSVSQVNAGALIGILQF